MLEEDVLVGSISQIGPPAENNNDVIIESLAQNNELEGNLTWPPPLRASAENSTTWERNKCAEKAMVG